MTDRLLTDDELAAIEAVWKASTPGDWRVEYDEDFLEEDGPSVRWPQYILTEPLPYAMAPGGSELVMDVGDGNCRDEDAEFVVNAHRSVPRLLAHIRAQDAELARLLDEREEPYRILADIRDALLGQPGDPLCDRWLGATVGDAWEIPGLAQDRQAERDTLVAANARLRDALAALVDAEAHGTPGGYIGVDPSGETHDRHCTYCYTSWQLGEPERHDDDCPVAVARVLLDGADTPGEGGA